LFSGPLNGAKALKQNHRNGVPQRIKKDGIIKDVINTFDQITLLNEVEKLINDSENDCRNKKNLKAIEEGLAIPYDRDKIKLASLELTLKELNYRENVNGV
jgi:hypothetical protein